MLITTQAAAFGIAPSISLPMLTMLLLGAWICAPMRLLWCLALTLMIRPRGALNNALNHHGLMLKMILEPVFSDALTILLDRTTLGSALQTALTGEPMPTTQRPFVLQTALLTPLLTMTLIGVWLSVLPEPLQITRLGNV